MAQKRNKKPRKPLTAEQKAKALKNLEKARAAKKKKKSHWIGGHQLDKEFTG